MDINTAVMKKIVFDLSIWRSLLYDKPDYMMFKTFDCKALIISSTVESQLPHLNVFCVILFSFGFMCGSFVKRLRSFVHDERVFYPCLRSQASIYFNSFKFIRLKSAKCIYSYFLRQSGNYPYLVLSCERPLIPWVLRMQWCAFQNLWTVMACYIFGFRKCVMSEEQCIPSFKC